MVDLIGENLKTGYAELVNNSFFCSSFALSFIIILVRVEDKEEEKKTDHFRPLSSGFSTPLAALLLYLIYQGGAYLEEHVWLCVLLVDEHIFYRVKSVRSGWLQPVKD